jgi:Helix-turn-helix domain
MNAEKKSQLTPTEWQTLIDTIGGQLSPEERLIATMLAQEETQAAIAVQMGLHRSAVWRRATAIAKRGRQPNG